MIKLVNVSKYYHTNNVVALGLRKANLEFRLNEFVAVVGESGSGKTTLLNVISGIDTYEEGEMYINGEETSYFSTADLENYRKKYIAFVFQNYNLVDSYTVLQNVELPLVLAGYTKKEAKKRAMEIIKRVGLEKHAHHKSTKLSGGQKQRVVIARALAKNCPIIAADEPTGNLDSESAKQIIELLHEISKDKLVIVVTHDFEQVREYATRKIRIYDGEIVEDAEIVPADKQDLPTIGDSEKKIRVEEHIKLALTNLLSVPKKTILMVLVFFLFSFFVAMVYGAYQLAVTGESGYSYYFSEEYFINKSVSRIVLNKADRTAFTEAELEAIGDYNQVQSVVPFDYLLDVETYFRSNLIFEEAYSSYNYISNVRFLPESILGENEELIKYGDMPDEAGEVLLAMNPTILESEENRAFYLDQEYTLSQTDEMSISPEVEYEIVGLLSVDDLFVETDAVYMILPDAEFESLAKKYYPAFLREITAFLERNGEKSNLSDIFFYEIMLYGNIDFLIDETLADDEILFTQNVAYYFCDPYATGDTGDCDDLTFDLTFTDGYSEVDLADLKVLISEVYEESQAIYFSPDVYEQIFYDDIYQISVFTDSNINVNRLVNNLSDIKVSGEPKYKVIYPFAFETDDALGSAIDFFSTLGMLIALIATIIGSTFLSYIIFRAIINTKLKDYAIFRTVGANQMVIRLLIYLENVFVVIVSFIIFVAFTIILKNIDGITKYSSFYGLKVFGFMDYLIYFGIMILMSVLISSRYCGRVFRESVQISLKAE